MLFSRIEDLLLGDGVVYGRGGWPVSALEVCIHGFIGLLPTSLEFIHDALTFTRLPQGNVGLNVFAHIVQICIE